MRVLFIYSLRDVLSPKRPLESLADIHIGVSYLSAFLKQRGHSTRLLVLNSESGRHAFSRLEDLVRSFNPDLVAFTAVSTQYPFIRNIAQKLKSTWPRLCTVIGGVHASLVPEEPARDGFDAVCIGEGEQPLAEFVEQLQAGRQPPEGIRNLWLRRRDGSIEKNTPRNFTEQLELLPFPDRDLWLDWVMTRQLTRQVVLPSRGCPYGCTYCSNHALRKISGGKYVRLRPVEDVLSEIRFLQQRFPETTDVYLQSETIAINTEWLEDLCNGIQVLNREMEQPISFTCNFRVARPFLTERIFAALQHANVKALEIGLESGSEQFRRRVLRRHYSNEDFLRAVYLARKHGMRVNVYNMIGLPGETPEDYWKTVEVNWRAAPDLVMTSIFHPYPGTALYEVCAARGLLPSERHMTTERFRAAVDYPEFPRRAIQRAFDWFEFRIYRGHKPLQYRLRRTLRNKAYSQAWAHALFLRLLPLWHALRGRDRIR